MRTWPGRPYPLGATWDGGGVNFAIYSDHAKKVELCLFDGPESTRESTRIVMPEQTDLVWHVYLPDAEPDWIYGYRVYGPYEPGSGHRFNPNKIVLDPYAKAIGRPLRWDDSVYGYQIGAKDGDLSFDERDSAPFAPLARVIDPSFVWGGDAPPRTPWHKTLIYETHVKGATIRNPTVPEHLRGTFLGLASEPMLEHFLSLGVTAVELQPVHYHVDERILVERGLVNYWGYNTLGFFAPDDRWTSAASNLGAVQQFKAMVRSFHSVGIEVILDVVYNHTAEGNQNGPTLSWRGVDNASYYNLNPDDMRYYSDFTGCGNTPFMAHPRVLQLIMDSLRYWAIEMHVDGFRFDLASTLARALHEVEKLGAFFDVIHQDPVVSQLKLIAEPWDVGPGGYQVGNFPVGWTEWNGVYRDDVRSFWKGDGRRTANELATRLSGSPDLYQSDGRTPYASINFITCHDGFNLQDLVSYDEKHNEANGEENRDGSDQNLSWNCGVEGPSDDLAVLDLRDRQKRNLISTLFFSQGVPMILGGDELGRSQHGNNNAYCQDNETSWYDWDLDDRRKAFLEFVRKVGRIRRNQPVFQRRRFFKGRPIRGEEVKDVSWFTPAGVEMNDQDWEAGFVRCLGIRLAGDCVDEVDEKGKPVTGDTLLILLNGHYEGIPFTLPAHRPNHHWEFLFDTADPASSRRLNGESVYNLKERSLVLLVLRPDSESAEGPGVVRRSEQASKEPLPTA